VLKRPAFAPVPAFAIKALYGEMSEVVLTGQNAIPALAYGHGFEFAYKDLEPALRDVLGKA
jgi:NAD dependent epimerase/dehydratase family enzyme